MDKLALNALSTCTDVAYDSLKTIFITFQRKWNLAFHVLHEISSLSVSELEIVFVKHYAPNHMLASKDNKR